VVALVVGEGLGICMKHLRNVCTIPVRLSGSLVASSDSAG